MKTKFKVGDRVRLLPRNSIRGQARKGYLSPGRVCGIPNELYAARAAKIQVLGAVYSSHVELLGDVPQLSYPLALIRAVKPAKRKKAKA